MNTVWHEDDDSKMLAMWHEHKTIVDIAKAFGRSRNAVSGRIFRLRGREGIQPHRRRGVRYTKEEDEQIRIMRAQGMYIQDIAVKLGRPWQSVHKRVQDIQVYRGALSSNVSMPNLVVKRKAVPVPMTKSEMYAMLRQAVLNTGGQLI